MLGLQESKIEVIVMAPDTADALREYRVRHGLACRMVSDHDGRLLRRLGQPVHWWQLGRLPATLAVAANGDVVYTHIGRSVRDIPKFTTAALWFNGQS